MNQPRIFLFLFMAVGFLCVAFVLKKIDPDDTPKLAYFIPSACDGTMDVYRLKNRIISKELIGDSLFLALGLRENCCVDFNPRISWQNGVLNVINVPPKQFAADGEEIMIVCECDCCYELTLVITGMRDTNFTVFYEERFLELSAEPYFTTPEEYEIYQGDTINLINRYGVKEGWWFEFDSQGRITKKSYWNGTIPKGWYEKYPTIMQEYDNTGVMIKQKHNDTSWVYNEHGTVLSKSVFHKENYMLWYEEMTFYENGNLESYCIPKNIKQSSFWLIDSCRYWLPDGTTVDSLP